jgi:hypothetical protein
MNLELTDEQTAALARELDQIIRNDRYFLGPPIRILKEILAKLKPESARPAPLPPLRNYEPPRMGRYRRRQSADTARGLTTPYSGSDP